MDVETRIRQVLVVVGRQRADFVVGTRKHELAVLDGRQSKENGVVRRYLEMFHHHLNPIVINRNDNNKRTKDNEKFDFDLPESADSFEFYSDRIRFEVDARPNVKC